MNFSNPSNLKEFDLYRPLRNSLSAIIFWRFEAAGAKALAHFAPLTARLKPCPCYKTQFKQSFVTASSSGHLRALVPFQTSSDSYFTSLYSQFTVPSSLFPVTL
jgi:hypothetical protein